jgi:hypothetical protein
MYSKHDFDTYKKYKKLMNSKLPSWSKTSLNMFLNNRSPCDLYTVTLDKDAESPPSIIRKS